MTGLRQLILSFNHISVINNNAFVGLDLLEELFLDHNHLNHVPSIALQSLKRLRILQIGSNFFTQISTGDFVHTPIESLFLNNCPDMELIDRTAFWDLPALQILDLSSNSRLAFIDPEAFRGVPSLNTLLLHNSSIRVIQREMISSIMQHRTSSSSSSSSEQKQEDGTLSAGGPSISASSISNSNSVIGLNEGPAVAAGTILLLRRDGEPEQRLRLSLQGTPLLCDCNVRYLYQVSSETLYFPDTCVAV